MRMTRIRVVATLAVLGLPCLAPASASAAWPHDPNNGNVALCTAPGNQYMQRALSDGEGGLFVVWEDYRSGTGDIYIQRVDAAGAPRWTINGVALCAAADGQYDPWIASDGAGGAIVAWGDYRDDPNYRDIYVQRVSPAGVPLWTPDGVALCTALGDQVPIAVVSDGAGGAIVAWEDIRSGDSDVYARRVDAAGTPQWTADGVPLSTAADAQYPYSAASDGMGGAIVAWEDRRSGTQYDIYARRVDAAGAPQWTADGVAVCTAANDQFTPMIVPDGVGGAIVSWRDDRIFSSDIYTQRISAAGAPQWTGNGVALCTAPGNQGNPTIESDGAGGAIVAWYDQRSVSADVYVQRVSAAGTPQWAANGVPLCTAFSEQAPTGIVSDGTGGAIVAWNDQRSVSADVYAQRVSSAGVPQWTTNGIALCTAVGSQELPVVASDGAGGAIVAWYDQRSGPGYDIYAQRIERFGKLGSPEPASAGVRDLPNDQGGKVKVSWYASYLDRELDPNLTAYDVYRSAPGIIAMRAVQEGARELVGFGDVPLPGERAFVIEGPSAQLHAWEYLATVNAVHFLEAYGYVAATTGDSIPGSSPLTFFMVVGRNANGSMYWLSAPDSGHSVDNLPPAVPAPFTGTYTSGTVELTWGANQETDFAHYRLYRAWGPNFVPGPDNLVVQTPIPGYAYTPGEYFFYKLSAVDIHGNESGFASLAPPGTLDAAEEGQPERLALGPAQPNPVVEGTEFRFALPRGGPVRLLLFDAQGRRVRELVTGPLPAGEHSARWDGRDATGRRVPSGLYICRLEADGRTLTRRLAAIH